MEIISDIYADFNEALKGIRQLPSGAKLGVYTAYYYYRKLLKKIEHLPAQRILEKRIRISNARKLYLATRTLVSYELRMF